MWAIGHSRLHEHLQTSIQGSDKRRFPDLVNFVADLAYHICLALPAVFTQPGDILFPSPLVSARPHLTQYLLTKRGYQSTDPSCTKLELVGCAIPQFNGDITQPSRVRCGMPRIREGDVPSVIYEKSSGFLSTSVSLTVCVHGYSPLEAINKGHPSALWRKGGVRLKDVVR